MSQKKIRRIFATISHYCWTFFVSGFLTILPLALTIALFHFAFRLIKNWFEPVHRVIENTALGSIAHIELIVVVLVIFLVGVFMQTVILRSLVHLLEKLVFAIPLVRPIYSGIKQLVHAFNPHDKHSFKKVVLIQFPRMGTYSLGFVTSKFPLEIDKKNSEQLFSVFVPHTPNPTSGFLVVVEEADITLVDITRQEAMSLIISGGIITPDRFKK